MNAFLIALELFLFAFSLYILLRKGELAIIYLPVIFFCDTVTDNHYINAFAYYGIVSCIILRLITLNMDFLGKNVCAGLLILYFLILMTKAHNLGAARTEVFNVMWYFVCLPLLISIYKKHSKNVIFKELANSCFIILCIFIISILLATWFRYNPYEMYGITGGLLFGNLYATDFNIIGPAIFILLFWSLNKKNFVYLAVTIISLAFISLSMRRSVMGISMVGVAIVSALYLLRNTKHIVPFIGTAVLVGLIVLTKTDFAASMNERYELRNLEERNINEEARYFEYKLLYDDVFRYNRYSLWTGFDLFNSPGNYGGGKFYERSLHGDITSIGHSSGLIGIALYFMMIITAFLTSFRAATDLTDKLTILFCGIAFFSYCLTGRYTQVGCMIMIFLIAMIPVASGVRVPEATLAEDPEEFNHVNGMVLNRH